MSFSQAIFKKEVQKFETRYRSICAQSKLNAEERQLKRRLRVELEFWRIAI